VTALAEGGDGRLWMADVDGSVWTLQVAGGRVEMAGGGTPPPAIPSAVLVARDGRCWVATAAGTLHWTRPNDGSWHDVTVPAWGGGAIRCLAEDRRGRIWAGGVAERVAYGTAEGSWTSWGPENGLTVGGVMSILGDREGTVWLGLNALGLYQWLGEEWSHRRSWSAIPSAGSRIVVFGVSRAAPGRGVLVAVANGGVLRLTDGGIERYGPEQGLTEATRHAVEPEPGRAAN
jgi:ligand-binding sensor domain-containing protein